MTNEARVAKGEKPPEIIEHDGKRYRPTWKEVTTDSDRRIDQQVYVVAAMGHPLEEGEEGGAIKK